MKIFRLSFYQASNVCLEKKNNNNKQTKLALEP